MQSGWKKRAVIWATVVESARANRAKYPQLPTAWLPHAIGNTVLLAAPELTKALDQWLASTPPMAESLSWQGVRRAVRQICTDNPDWAQYVAPMALGYILSHPRFNIYQGDLGEMRLAGLGLDAIPHAMTACAVTRLAYDGLDALRVAVPSHSPLAALVRPLAARGTTVSMAVLLELTAVWEIGEYSMQQEELRRMDGDYEAINMQWDVPDTLADLIANLIGWLVATWQQQAASGPA